MKILRRIIDAYNRALDFTALSTKCRHDTLHTKVIKAGIGRKALKALRCESTHQTWHQAGVWIPDRTIRVLHILIAEQSEIALYVDIEVSLHPQMLNADQDEQLFRYKYAGPAVQWNPPCPVQYAGSNTTNNIINLTPQGIVVKKGTPIYVHLDVINWSPIDVCDMIQDVTLYYTLED
ncbi:MAG: hypothetical protein Q8R36_04985 [bacterium]|nr:hypothetical protein [bacterium]